MIRFRASDGIRPPSVDRKLSSMETLCDLAFGLYNFCVKFRGMFRWSTFVRGRRAGPAAAGVGGGGGNTSKSRLGLLLLALAAILAGTASVLRYDSSLQKRARMAADLARRDRPASHYPGVRRVALLNRPRPYVVTPSQRVRQLQPTERVLPTARFRLPLSPGIPPAPPEDQPLRFAAAGPTTNQPLPFDPAGPANGTPLSPGPFVDIGPGGLAAPIVPSPGTTPGPALSPTVSALPEPAVWMQMAFGFALTGWALRRQRRPIPA